jgi:YD repeat-containing protein
MSRDDNACTSLSSLGSGDRIGRLYVNYDYDYAGRRTAARFTKEDTSQRTEHYGYDDLSRLSSVDYGDGHTQSYTFDALGNRLTKTDDTATQTYAYDANMLVSRGGLAYTNDLNGNTLTGGGRTMTWDSQNRLVQCASDSTATIAYEYGPDGLRRKKGVPGGPSTTYLLDGQSVAQAGWRRTVPPRRPPRT